MRLHRAAIGFAAAFLLCATPTLAFEMDINLITGFRSFSDDSIQEVDEQIFAGVDVGFGIGHYMEIVAGLYASGDDTSVGSDNYELDIYEVSAGVLVKDRYGRFRPFVGGGFSYVIADTALTSGTQDFDDDDKVTGVYITGGAYWRLGKIFNLGLSTRALLGADVEYDLGAGKSLKQEANYFQIGILFGIGFGESN